MNPNYWALIAQKGDQGPQGPTGATGATGAKGDKGDTGATGQGFSFKGSWSNSQVYNVNDVVYYDGTYCSGDVGAYIQVLENYNTNNCPAGGSGPWVRFA
jgi:hypothetical protein